MNLHDRLLVRSVGSVLGIVLLAMTYGYVAGFRADQLWMGAPVAVALVLAIVATRLGYGALTAWALTLFCTGTLIGYVAVTGGVESHYVVYLGLCVFGGWIWSSARGGIAVTVVLAVSLAVLGVVRPTPLLEGSNPSIDIALACLISALWLSFVVTDLRNTLRNRLASTATLEQSAREALWDDQARDRFLAMVSHEFRTPLNVVLGYEEMLREEEDNPERIRDLERIHAAGQHLLSLIDDLIDLSTNEEAELPLAVETVTL
ncbi:MAG: histidine kinase dimerization/phospho-acceptor domain-containing protein, partial [Myxococcota bacterium]